MFLVVKKKQNKNSVFEVRETLNNVFFIAVSHSRLVCSYLNNVTFKLDFLLFLLVFQM